jgi:hypothetical protein
VIDQRQLTCRTDAVYQAEGPPPPIDVADGRVTEAGPKTWTRPASCAAGAGW